MIKKVTDVPDSAKQEKRKPQLEVYALSGSILIKLPRKIAHYKGELFFLVSLRGQNWNTLQVSLERIAMHLDDKSDFVYSSQYGNKK